MLAPEQKGAKPSSERKRWEREDSGLSASEQPGTVEGQEQCQSRECLRATEITGCVPGFRKAVIFFFLQEASFYFFILIETNINRKFAEKWGT